MSEYNERKNTRHCIEVADAALRLFGRRGVKDEGDGLFASSYMVAQHVRRMCPNPLDRPAMIATITQIISVQALDIDQSILQKNGNWKVGNVRTS